MLNQARGIPMTPKAPAIATAPAATYSRHREEVEADRSESTIFRSVSAANPNTTHRQAPSTESVIRRPAMAATDATESHSHPTIDAGRFSDFSPIARYFTLSQYNYHKNLLFSQFYPSMGFQAPGDEGVGG